MQRDNRFALPTARSDLEALLIQNLQNIKNDILNKDWKFEEFDWGGKKYWGKETTYKDKKYPNTALQIVRKIEQILSGDTDIISGINRINEYLIKSKSSSRYETYQDYEHIINMASLFVAQMIKVQLTQEIERMHQEFSFIREDKNSVHTKYVAQLLRIEQQLSDALLGKVTSPIKLLETVNKELATDTKLVNFYSKKILPFITKLQVAEQPPASEATEDLKKIIHALIQFNANPNQPPLVQCLLNGLGEIVVHIGDEKYNLTQILKYEPDFSQLDLNSQLLDEYFDFLKDQDKRILSPDFQNNAALSNLDWIKKSPDTFMRELNIDLLNHGEKNYYDDCHAAEILAMNIYSGTPFSIMNHLLRNKTIDPSLFSTTTPGSSFYSEFVKMKMSGQLQTKNRMQPSELDRLIQETILAVTVAASGSYHSQHASYQSEIPVEMINKQLDTTQGRSVSGATGPWVENVKNQYELAYQSGLPVYLDSFRSTTYDPQIAEQFAELVHKKQTSNHLITKNVALDVNRQGGIGVNISPISQYKKEAEYLYPPGCIMLPTPESEIQQTKHYAPALEKKVAVVMTKGVSTKSYFYSTELQNQRNSLIELLDEMKKYNGNLIPEDQKKLNQMMSSLEKLIHRFENNLKHFDFAVVDLIAPDVINNPKFSNSDSLFLLSKTGLLCFFDNQTKKKIEVQLTHDEMVNLLVLFKINPGDAHLNQISYEKICFLEKLIGQPITLHNETSTLINKSSNEINQIHHDFQMIQNKMNQPLANPKTNEQPPELDATTTAMIQKTLSTGRELNADKKIAPPELDKETQNKIQKDLTSGRSKIEMEPPQLDKKMQDQVQSRITNKPPQLDKETNELIQQQLAEDKKFGKRR